MIVNQSFARRYFQGRSPVGRKVRAAGKWCTVIGLARDSRYFSPGEAPAAHFYLAFAQFYAGSSELYVLVRSPRDQAVAVFRQAVRQTDTGAAAFHTVPLSEYTQVATFGQKVAANLMAALGLMCLVLAASGLYSVMSYTVSQRVAEIGIRIAMGARPANVIAMVVGQGMQMTVIGLAAGMVLSFAVTRMISGMLFDVTAVDPATFAMAGAFLGVVALGATWLPAWRATRIDPMQALRR
jgi:ABC-type antimicrobial peptide transport system permease subunit